MFEGNLVDLQFRQPRSHVRVFAEVDSLSVGVTAAYVQADAHVGGQLVDELIKHVRRPACFVRRQSQDRLVKLDVVAAGVDDLQQLVGQHIDERAGDGDFVFIEVGPLVDREPR